MSLHLYLMYIKHCNNSDLQKVIPFLSKETQNKIAKQRLITDQWRVALTDLMLRKILAQELGTNPDAIKIAVDDYGKPFIEGKARQFNLSHAESVIILATDDTPIGVDVEYVRSFEDLDHLLTNFSEEEQLACLEKSGAEKVVFFYELWSLKESYLKALGQGLSCPLDSFSISVTKNEVSLLKAVDADVSWYFKCYAVGPDYKCAVCARHKYFPEKIVKIDTSELLDLDF